MAKLGEVCKVSPSTKNIERQGAWLLNLDMVEQQTGRVIEYKYVGEDDLNGSIIQFDTENVLYSKLRPNLNKVVLPPKDGFSTSELLPLRPDASVLNKDYLAAFLRSDSFVTWAVSKTAGAKMPRLGTKDLMNAEIPVPSIEQQKKIAEKFKKLEQLISLRKQQLAKLDELVKARFVEMFGELHKTKYNIKTLDELCEFIKDGTHQTPTYVDVTEGYKFLSSKDVTSGYIDWSSIKYISEELHQELYKRIAPQRGDILLAKNGTTGIPAIVETDETFDIYVSLALLRLKPNNNVRYIWSALRMPETKAQFDNSLKGVGVPNLHLGEIKKTKIIVPPFSLQNQFSAFVERVDKQKQTVQQSLEKLELMKKALMQEYFG